MTLIANQAVKFITGSYVGHNNLDCVCFAKPFYQLVQRNDVSEFEMRIGESTDNNSVSDGTFTTGIPWTGWGLVWQWDVITQTAFADGTGTLWQYGPNFAGIPSGYYKIQYTIGGYVQGTMDVQFGTQILSGCQGSSDGTITCYGWLDITDPPQIGFVATAFRGYIDNVSVFEMYQAGYRIVDPSVDYSDPNKNIYEDFSTPTPGGCEPCTIDYFEDWVRIRVDWSQVPDLGKSCYEIQLFIVGVNLIINPNMQELLAPPWVIIFGVYDAVNNEIDYGADGTLLQNTILTIGKEYRAQIELKNTAGGGMDYSIMLLQSVHTANMPNANGVWIDTGKSTNGNYQVPVFRNVSLTNIYVRELTFIASSEPFILDTQWRCTHLLSWTNNNDAFGFNYSGLTFIQYVRLKAKLWKSSYDKTEKVVFTDSQGNKIMLHSKAFKKYIFSLEEIPEYLHDAISLAVDHQTLTIDGVLYSNAEESYEPNWRNSAMLAPAEIEVYETPQQLENSLCT